jgi:tol-pal system protein YbgF
MNSSRLNFFLFLFITLFSAFFLSSCASDNDFAYLNDQVGSLNKRVTKLQDTVDSNIGSKLSTAQGTQAQMQVEVDRLKGRISELTGRIEDNERIIKRTVERDLGEQDTLQGAVAELSQRVKELEATVKYHGEYLGFKSQAPREGSEPKMPPGKKEADIPRDLEKKMDSKTKDVDLYDASLASFKEGKYEVAMDSLREFLKKYPNSDRADNAWFWIGECHMGLKQWDQAILAFQEVIKKYPKGNKVPNALLRQAVAFLEIHDKTSSKLLLQKIVKSYPDSNEARIAKEKLKTLGP